MRVCDSSSTHRPNGLSGRKWTSRWIKYANFTIPYVLLPNLFGRERKATSITPSPPMPHHSSIWCSFKHISASTTVDVFHMNSYADTDEHYVWIIAYTHTQRTLAWKCKIEKEQGKWSGNRPFAICVYYCVMNVAYSVWDIGTRVCARGLRTYKWKAPVEPYFHYAIETLHCLNRAIKIISFAPFQQIFQPVHEINK